jgi:hypothetical protein
VEMLAELEGYLADPPAPGPDHLGFAVPMRLSSTAGELRLITAVTTLSTAVDVTLSELRLETFLPADAETATALATFASRPREPVTWQHGFDPSPPRGRLDAVQGSCNKGGLS